MPFPLALPLIGGQLAWDFYFRNKVKNDELRMLGDAASLTITGYWGLKGIKGLYDIVKYWSKMPVKGKVGKFVDVGLGGWMVEGTVSHFKELKEEQKKEESLKISRRKRLEEIDRELERLQALLKDNDEQILYLEKYLDWRKNEIEPDPDLMLLLQEGGMEELGGIE